jgi:hypothetical protein
LKPRPGQVYAHGIFLKFAKNGICLQYVTALIYIANYCHIIAKKMAKNTQKVGIFSVKSLLFCYLQNLCRASTPGRICAVPQQLAEFVLRLNARQNLCCASTLGRICAIYHHSYTLIMGGFFLFATPSGYLTPSPLF